MPRLQGLCGRAFSMAGCCRLLDCPLSVAAVLFVATDNFVAAGR